MRPSSKRRRFPELCSESHIEITSKIWTTDGRTLDVIESRGTNQDNRVAIDLESNPLRFLRVSVMLVSPFLLNVYTCTAAEGFGRPRCTIGSQCVFNF